MAALIGTVGLSYLAAPVDTRQFFADPMGSVTRGGWLGYPGNQSWLGTLSRIVGYDVGTGLLVPAAIAVTAALGAIAWWALGRGTSGRDALGSLLIVQLFGLTASPISWAHHWVWLVPLVIWLAVGPWCGERGAKALAWVWGMLLVIGIPTLTSTMLRTEAGEFSQPWYLAWGEAVYIPMTLATFIWIIVTGARSRRAVLVDEADAQRDAALPGGGR